MNAPFWEALGNLSVWGQVLFFLVLFVAFAFEFINGFHDTANAVTTVIYTKNDGCIQHRKSFASQFAHRGK